MKIIISGSNNFKIVKSASGKQTIRISKSSWEEIGRTAGWLSKEAASFINVETLVSVLIPELVKQMQAKNIGDGLATKFYEEIDRLGLKNFTSRMNSFNGSQKLNYAKNIGRETLNLINMISTGLSDNEKQQVSYPLAKVFNMCKQVREFLSTPSSPVENGKLTDTNNMYNKQQLTDTQKIKAVVPNVSDGKNNVQNVPVQNKRYNLDEMVNVR